MSPTDIPDFLYETVVPVMVAVGQAIVRVPRMARHMAAPKKSAMERMDELIAKARDIKFNLQYNFA